MKLNLDLLINILMVIIIISTIIAATILILNEFSPFKTCETNPDNYTIEFNHKNYTCGELRAINTSI